jgi:hypothetical protein
MKELINRISFSVSPALFLEKMYTLFKVRGEELRDVVQYPQIEELRDVVQYPQIEELRDVVQYPQIPRCLKEQYDFSFTPF